MRNCGRFAHARSVMMDGPTSTSELQDTLKVTSDQAHTIMSRLMMMGHTRRIGWMKENGKRGGKAGIYELTPRGVMKCILKGTER